jgi:hypothetical protein
VWLMSTSRPLQSVKSSTHNPAAGSIWGMVRGPGGNLPYIGQSIAIAIATGNRLAARFMDLDFKPAAPA